MSEIIITYDSFNKVCRFCLEHEPLLLNPIFDDLMKMEIEDLERKPDLSVNNKINMIEQITNLKVAENDGLPQFMCSACYILVESVMKFQIVSRDSDYMLRKVLADHLDKENDMDPLDAFPETIFDDYVEDETVVKTETILPEEGDSFIESDIELDRTESDPDWGVKKEPDLETTEEYEENISEEGHIIYEIKTKLSPIPKVKRPKQTKEERKMKKEEARKRREENMTLIVCDVCGEPHKYIKSHMRKHLDGHLECEFCDKKFHNQIHLDRHVNVHTRAVKYDCDQCDKSYFDKHSLKTHKIVHTGVKSHKCEICGRLFNLRTGLVNHRATHFQNRKYECEECGKKFLTGTSFRQHQRIHTGEKPYLCNYCSEKFRTAGMVGIHAKRVHPVEVARDGKIMYTFESNDPKIDHKTT